MNSLISNADWVWGLGIALCRLASDFLHQLVLDSGIALSDLTKENRLCVLRNGF
jgi:hypothetical protein